MSWTFYKNRPGGTGVHSQKRNAQSLSELQRKKVLRRQVLWSAFLGTLVFSLACLFLHWLIWSPWFQIKKIEYSGFNRSTEENVLNYLRAAIAGGNGLQRAVGYEHILAWPRQATWEKPASLPMVAQVSTGRDFWSRVLRIEVMEWQPIGIWCSIREETEDCAWFSNDGTIFQKAPLAEGSLIPVIRDFSGRELRLGEKILGPDNKTTNLLSIFTVLSAEKISTKEVRLEKSAADEIKVLQMDGPEMYFSLRFPADLTQGPMHALKEKGWSNLQYIDFRIENRVYYK
ncbi:MAG: hypothetical protein V1856_00265 [Candidatus Liptonbacteria bacterium]